LLSLDATVWRTVNSGTTNWLFRVRAAGGRLVAVGQRGTILTSTNGEDWSARTSGTTRWLNGIARLNSRWLVVGNQGTVLTSTNLSNWTSVPPLTRKSFYGVCTNDGRFVIVGVEGSILRTQILQPDTPVNIVEYNRVSGQNLFLFHGPPDQVFTLQRSTNLTNWSNGRTLELLDPTGVMLYLDESNPDPPGVEVYRTVIEP
jgi:hypothetical protein